MKKVIRTKKPSLAQLHRMVFNLQEKFHKNVSMHIEYATWYEGEITSWCYIEDINVSTHKIGWEAIQDWYFKCMEMPNEATTS
uniref:Uncharacterized protein n=1 Tax=viral metagenome TaxID=1070528 RepID=A0A6M3JRK3_9ZZZZ